MVSSYNKNEVSFRETEDGYRWILFSDLNLDIPEEFHNNIGLKIFRLPEGIKFLESNDKIVGLTTFNSDYDKEMWILFIFEFKEYIYSLITDSMVNYLLHFNINFFIQSNKVRIVLKKKSLVVLINMILFLGN